jgi:hypothetical protein
MGSHLPSIDISYGCWFSYFIFDSLSTFKHLSLHSPLYFVPHAPASAPNFVKCNIHQPTHLPSPFHLPCSNMPLVPCSSWPGHHSNIILYWFLSLQDIGIHDHSRMLDGWASQSTPHLRVMCPSCHHHNLYHHDFFVLNAMHWAFTRLVTVCRSRCWRWTWQYTILIFRLVMSLSIHIQLYCYFFLQLFHSIQCQYSDPS